MAAHRVAQQVDFGDIQLSTTLFRIRALRSDREPLLTTNRSCPNPDNPAGSPDSPPLQRIDIAAEVRPASSPRAGTISRTTVSSPCPQSLKWMRSVYPLLLHSENGWWRLRFVADNHHLLLHIQFSVLALNEPNPASTPGLGGNNALRYASCQTQNSGKSGDPGFDFMCRLSGNGESSSLLTASSSCMRPCSSKV